MTVGNCRADYLSFSEYMTYNSVLNYLSLVTELQKSSFYKTLLVAKETEVLISKEGSAHFPLSFHILHRHEVYNPSGFIVSSNTRSGHYRRIDPSETLPQLTPGTDRFTVIGGPWRTLNAYGQSLIKASVSVGKTYNSSN